MEAKQLDKSQAKSKRLSQSEVPSVSVEEALRVATALHQELGNGPARPLDVAIAMSIEPTSGRFRTLTGASIAYGFTSGGAFAPEIELTDLGRRAVAPTVEGDDIAARREGFLRPRIIGEFMRNFDSKPFPQAKIAANLLENMGVPRKFVDARYQVILDGARSLGLTQTTGKREYASLTKSAGALSSLEAELAVIEPLDGEVSRIDSEPDGDVATVDRSADQDLSRRQAGRKVFVSHGKNRKIVQHIKDVLGYGDFEPIVSVERESTSKPVPAKVLDDMRACAAGIIHVGSERQLLDDAGKSVNVLNENVLIEIGAAMALYKDKFILLVEKDVELPSNLQGLYEVRFEGEELGGDETMRLLKALKAFKT